MVASAVPGRVAGVTTSPSVGIDIVVAVPNNEDMGRGDVSRFSCNAVVAQVTSSVPIVMMSDTAQLTRNSSSQPLSPIASFASVPLSDGCEQSKRVQSRPPSGFGRRLESSQNTVDPRRQRSTRLWSSGSASHAAAVPLQTLCILSFSSMAVAAPTTMVAKRSSGGGGKSMIKIIVSRAWLQVAVK